jgi:hypothetical protein
LRYQLTVTEGVRRQRIGKRQTEACFNAEGFELGRGFHHPCAMAIQRFTPQVTSCVRAEKPAFAGLRHMQNARELLIGMTTQIS